MNERIEKFAEDSGMTQYVAANNKHLGRFVELIIEECVNLMENQKEHYHSKIFGAQSAEHYDRIISKGDAFEDAATIIRSHFRNNVT